MKLIVGVSCIIFNQPKPQLLAGASKPLKLLLIQREKDPYKGKWCFAGGKLELGETYSKATQREVREELGLEVELYDEQRPDYINEIIFNDKQYMVVSTAAYVAENSIRSLNHEGLTNQWFQYPHEIEQLREEDCLPKLHSIIHKVVNNHFPKPHIV